ncbi:MAG: hypothetical protein KDD36_09290 [Flavobacteriales bacterium]|nr:hypothetical protein [Flavobacteriales bacterium]
MQTYNIELRVQARDEQELAEKLQAFQDLQDHLEHDDMMQATEIIVEHPELVEFIKEVVPEEGQELSLSDYIAIARKAWVKFG